jgi:D-alanyl-D-alanine carboxypeptidase
MPSPDRKWVVVIEMDDRSWLPAAWYPSTVALPESPSVRAVAVHRRRLVPRRKVDVFLRVYGQRRPHVAATLPRWDTGTADDTELRSVVKGSPRWGRICASMPKADPHRTQHNTHRSWLDSVRLSVALIFVTLALCGPSVAQQLTADQRGQIDDAAMAVLNSTGAPSASVAIVRGGEIVYQSAYGDGRIDPKTPANSSMRYAIGSISKQFTATAILLLQEEGKLSLNDKVAKWFPELTRANDISLLQLLSMTSGYQDYWPQDYVFPDMQRPATAQTIMERWATKALDFAPGTQWQYSNTNYVIAAAIAERVSGMSFMDFLRQRIFTPLKMTSVADFDAAPLSNSDAEGSLRNALGPLRPAPKEGRGWLFGAGQLAMTAHDLALWDIAVINRSVLRPASYTTQQTDVILKSGNATGYGLGVTVSAPGGRRRISHGGGVSGYTTINNIYLDDRAAIVVLTNIYPGASNAPGQIADRIASIIFPPAETANAARDLARRIYDGLTKGTIDRALFTSAANAYFTPEVLSDYAASLAPLGSPTNFIATGESLRGGMTIRSFRIRAGDVVMQLTMMTLPDGHIDQYLIARAG